jgi:hypothetical protein
MENQVQRTTTLTESKQTFTTYHDNGYIKTIEETQKRTLEVVETVRFRMRLKQSLETFVKRKALDMYQAMAAPRQIKEDIVRRPFVTGGLYEHLDKPLRNALPLHLANLTTVRNALIRKHPLNGDFDDLPRLLFARTIWMRRTFTPLLKLFQAFEDITVKAYQYFEETHMPKKIQSLMGDFPDHVQELIKTNKPLWQYVQDFNKKTNEVAETWVHGGGNPADPMYKTYLVTTLKDWPTPQEINSARERFLGPCVCTRSPPNMTAVNHSFGFDPDQIMEFYPHHVDHKYPLMWQMYIDFEHGRFPVIAKYIASLHTVLRTAMFLKSTGGPPPEFKGAIILEVLAYHVGAPADYQSLPNKWNDECNGDWLTVKFAWQNKAVYTLALPGCYVHSLFFHVPSYIHLLEEFVEKEMDPVQEIPMTPVCVNEDGSLKYIPERLVHHAAEFLWLQDSDQCKALVPQSAPCMLE